MPLSRGLRAATQQREDDLAAEEFVELLVQALDIPEVAQAIALAVAPYVSQKIPRIPATDHPLPKPPPFVSGRGRRPKPR